ncbi:hypothetical protein QBC38DRAFT_26773 [Podospora fimiseda]|uniref:Uncharacterized protein n=1 Tax=Podospora fimiseda TaxID=252190 RepID=A0AAN7BIW6_9PEZI|nr:hypothetical protein QBC38DRAFT_26773 [Podospora fimiseda]
MLLFNTPDAMKPDNKFKPSRRRLHWLSTPHSNEAERVRPTLNQPCKAGVSLWSRRVPPTVGFFTYPPTDGQHGARPGSSWVPVTELASRETHFVWVSLKIARYRAMAVHCSALQNQVSRFSPLLLLIRGAPELDAVGVGGGGETRTIFAPDLNNICVSFGEEEWREEQARTPRFVQSNEKRVGSPMPSKASKRRLGLWRYQRPRWKNVAG